jgi:hypothetical protein
VVAFAGANYLPSLALLDRDPTLIPWLAPFAGGLLLLLTLQLWRPGVRRCMSTGN